MGVAFAARRPAARLRGRQGGRRCCATTRPGRRSRCPRASRARTSRASRSPARRRWSPPARDLLVNDGGGWRVDDGRARAVRALPAPTPRFVAVAGLPDGGAVAAGPRLRDRARRPERAVALRRRSRCSASRPSRSPRSATAARVRALAAVQPQLPYPVPDVLPETDPDSPPPLIPPFPLPGDGYLVRETDERLARRAAHRVRRLDRPTGRSKSDPVARAARRRRPARAGRSAAGAGSPTPPAAATATARRRAAPTARASRPRPSSATRPARSPRSRRRSPAPARTSTARRRALRDRRPRRSARRRAPTCATQALGPDLHAARGQGPRRRARRAARRPADAALHGRAPAGRRDADARARPGATPNCFSRAPPHTPPRPPPTRRTAPRRCSVARSRGRRRRSAAGSRRRASRPARRGGDRARARTTRSTPTAPAAPVRVIVIDNSRGSLAASDPHQNPPEPQLPWLRATLADARAQRHPGDRRRQPRPQLALPAVAERRHRRATRSRRRWSTAAPRRTSSSAPRRTASIRSRAAARTTIPAFGTGTLGYRSPLANTSEGPDAVFGDAGLLLAEVDTAKRDPPTNRAPVVARLLPVVSELTLQAVDGTLLRRSRPSLFQGLGRRPAGGDRWGPSVGGGDPQPPGSDPVHAASRRSRAPGPRARRGSRPSTSSPPRRPTSATSSRRTRLRRTCASR